MLVAVSQRISEIGLLKAIGATSAIFDDYFSLKLHGYHWLALIRILLGQLGSLLIRTLYPQFPAWAPAWASAALLVLH
jgi:putative ABC transport system permease protein